MRYVCQKPWHKKAAPVSGGGLLVNKLRFPVFPKFGNRDSPVFEKPERGFMPSFSAVSFTVLNLLKRSQPAPREFPANKLYCG